MKKKKSETIVKKVKYENLAIGEIKPEGWMKSQMELMTENYITVLFDKWNIISNNTAWLGGKGYSGELGLKFISSILPLAYQMDNESLKNIIKNWVKNILLSKNTNGNFGPQENNDWYNKIIAIKILLQYYDATKENGILEFCTKFFKYQYNEIDSLPPNMWCKARIMEEIALINYVYKRTENEFLLELIDKILKYSYDWKGYFINFKYKFKTSKYLSKTSIFLRKKVSKKQVVAKDIETAKNVNKKNDNIFNQKYSMTIGSNVASALKFIMQLNEYKPIENAETITSEFVDKLNRYHGLANGCFSSDEHLNGNNPNVGVDTSAMVEALSSYLDLMALTVDSKYADFAELIAYNAVPSVFNDDFTMVQTVSALNQIATGTNEYYSIGKENNNFKVLANNNTLANIFGAYPKFVQNLCLKNKNDLAFLIYAPCKISTMIGQQKLVINEITNYPFKNECKFIIEELAQNTELTLKFRAPKYSTIEIFVNDKSVVKAKAGLCTIKKEFAKDDEIKIIFNTPLTASLNSDRTISFRKGSLLFANNLDGKLEKDSKKDFYKGIGTNDYRKAPVVTKTSIDLEDIRYNDMTIQPYSMEEPNIIVRVKSSLVNNWSNSDENYREIPKKLELSSNKETLRLVPYGNTAVRIAHFPTTIKG